MNREKKDLKGGKRNTFFTGGNSTCRAHIHCHYNVYKERCKEKGIPENHHAIPREIWKEMQAEKLKGKMQVKIDEILEKSTAPQEFTCDGVLNAVARFVACDDQVWLDVLISLSLLMIRKVLGSSREGCILQLFSCNEAKSSRSRYAEYSQCYNLYPQ
jgi:hypothetical protein